jgi:hypothetical protein
MVDMTDILSRPAKDVEPPKKIPVGIYLWTITKVHTTDQNGQILRSAAGNQKIEFECETSVPVEVDPALLEGFHFPARLRLRFTITENSLYRFTQFLTEHLLLPNDLPVKDLINMATGRNFRGQVVHQPGTKPGDNNLYPNIVDTFPA